jgi:prepilin-type N-terminal cleavage/methylation domain-containing protein/prepilin-type processing-associated H-X9-DG protein
VHFPQQTRQDIQYNPVMNQRFFAAHRARRGFTLVELLIVVAIIATLVSILVPSLGTVREIGRTTVCASNMRQIGAAAVAYSAAHKRIILPCRIATPLGSGQYQYWANLLVDGKYLPAPRLPAAQVTSGAQAQGALFCPSGNMDFLPPSFGNNTSQPASRTDDTGANCTRLPLVAETPTGSPISGTFVDAWYGMNADRGSDPTKGHPGRCFETTSDVPVKTSNIPDASSMVLLYDGVYYHQAEVNANRVNARHGKKTQTNLLFVDGHVETWQTSLLPGGIGTAQVSDFSLASLAANNANSGLKWWLEQP